ncbi:MAG TPA: phytase [Bacteroidales bacterium]|nr:phytase [Bacteroidales bacterium]
MKKFFYLFVMGTLMAACAGRSNSGQGERTPGELEAIEDSLEYAAALADQARIRVSVQAAAETAPVPSVAGEDAADDPAIWYNAVQPEQSRIIGTDKKGGLAIYNLAGEELQYYALGRINNVDVRYGFELNGQKVDVVAASDRSLNTVRLFTITADTLVEVGTPLVKLDPSVVDEPYGLCMYRHKPDNSFYVFVGGKDGGVQQLRLKASGDSIELEKVRALRVATQAEGMVADDETGLFYLAVEEGGIHKFAAAPDGGTRSEVLPMSHGRDNTALVADLEGLDVYYGRDGKGFLIVSSQGNFSYALFDREAPHAYLGSFKIVSGTVDGVEETDGLSIFNGALGEQFPKGLLVVQDGFNRAGDSALPQNFKLVDLRVLDGALQEALPLAPDYLDWMK